MKSHVVLYAMFALCNKLGLKAADLRIGKYWKCDYKWVTFQFLYVTPHRCFCISQINISLSLVVGVSMPTTTMRMRALSTLWTQLVYRNHHISVDVSVRISGICVAVVDNGALIRISYSCWGRDLRWETGDNCFVKENAVFISNGLLV
jgi:hypothetical protein